MSSNSKPIAKWNFPLSNGGPVMGIADSGIETFKGSPIPSLAREICQNSLDAWDNKDKPVLVEFSLLKVPVNNIPGYDELKENIELAKKYWIDIANNKNAEKFFKTALKVLSQKETACFKISDFNTTGLLGTKNNISSPWHTLIKAKGASSKAGSQGGSFGIGKFASFSISALRTVFYSTYNKDKEAAYQGVSILPSFLNKDGEMTQGTGYYETDIRTPVFQQLSMGDVTQKRNNNDFGTDIYILGITDYKDWQEKIIKSVLDGFLYAIMQKKLVVIVGDIMIDENSLPKLFEEYEGFQEHADKYYRVLTSPEKKEFTGNILDLGEVKLTLLMDSDLPKRVAMVRETGMKIKDQNRLRQNISFAGVLYIEGDKLNQKLREIENPQHTAWEPDRADNKSEAKKMLKALRDFINQSLDQMVESEESETIDPVTGQFLSFVPDHAESTSQTDKSVTGTTVEVSVRKAEEIPKDPKSTGLSHSLDDEEDHGDSSGYGPEGETPGLPGEPADLPGGGDNPHPGGSKNKENPNPHSGEGGDSHPASPNNLKQISAKVRVIGLSNSEGKYRLKITSPVNLQDGTVKVLLAGEEYAEPVTLKKAELTDGTPLTVRSNMIVGLNLKADKPLLINAWINRSGYFSLETHVYETKE